MGINIKYYIISIASIFISLGIGIFIGFNMDSQEIYLKQQQILVDSLENRFIEFKKEKEDLEENIQVLNFEKEKQNIFIENVFHEIIYNKLLDLNVIIIEITDDQFDYDINETLKLSGAFIPIYIRYMDKIYNINEEKIQEINQLLNIRLKDNEDFINFINNEIINSLMFKDINSTLKFLINNDYIKYSYDFNDSDNFSIDGIIIIGGSEKKQNYSAQQLSIHLIKNLKKQQFNIVGVEKSDVKQSYIPTFKELNISTVDNIDNKIGKISLVYLLNGAKGHYGEKPTANSLTPFNAINSRE